MTTKSFFDYRNNQITFSYPPRRIISLVPSQTELLYDLGLDVEVVGITKFCVHPPHWLNQKKVIGGTKNFWFDIIDALNPDLILGNKEENYKEGIETLQKKYPVWISDIVSLTDALKMIEQMGYFTGREKRALEINQHIKTAFSQLKMKAQKRVLYLIWRNPWMGVASTTFIHTMLEQIGLINSLKDTARYPELTDEGLKKLDPEVIFLSSEPYPFQLKHQQELQQLFPSSKVMLVDGEMFSWYGSRLINAPAYFNSLVVE